MTAEEISKLHNAAPAMRDALLNLLGAFNTPLAKLVKQSPFQEEAIQSALDALEKARKG